MEKNIFENYFGTVSRGAALNPATLKKVILFLMSRKIHLFGVLFLVSYVFLSVRMSDLVYYETIKIKKLKLDI